MILKNKQPKKGVNLLNKAAIFFFFFFFFFKGIVSKCLQNELDAFKVNILFYSSSISVLSKPIFRWEIVFLFSKTPYRAYLKELRSQLDRGHKETPIISEIVPPPFFIISRRSNSYTLIDWFWYLCLMAYQPSWIT